MNIVENTFANIKQQELRQNPFYSLMSATIDTNPHQIEAYLFALSALKNGGAILADEVGLGKTIEAGLVIKHYFLSGKKNIILIMPSSLRKQWQIELKEKFDISAKVIDSENIIDYEYSSKKNQNIIIISYNFASNHKKLISDTAWDLCIFDEAHRMRNVHKNGSKMAAILCDITKGIPKIMLTATPMQNSLFDLYGLIQFIDPRILGDKAVFSERYLKNEQYDELKATLDGIIQRTLRSEVSDYIQYPQRREMTVDFRLSLQEMELYMLINQYLKKEILYALPNSRRTLITSVIRKLLASSSMAVAETFKALRNRLIVLKQSTREESSTESLDYFFNFFDEEDQELEDTEQKEELFTREKVNEFIQHEIDEVENIINKAEAITTNAKMNALKIAVKKAFDYQKDNGAPEKIVIFTESVRTQKYIFDELSNNGYKNEVLLFNGSGSDSLTKQIYNAWKAKNYNNDMGSRGVELKNAIVEAFKNDYKILLVTDSGSEGLNLQFCSTVINYDLPWNPQKIEQRIGRCHRYGQQYDVVVINLLNTENFADKRVYEILSNKFELFQGVFGASDKAIGLLESGGDFEKRVSQIYQECNSTTEFTKKFAALEKEIEGKRNKKLEELTGLITTKNFKNHSDNFNKLLSEYMAYEQEYLYWNKKETFTSGIKFPAYLHKSNTEKNKYLVIGGYYQDTNIIDSICIFIDESGTILNSSDDEKKSFLESINDKDFRQIEPNLNICSKLLKEIEQIEYENFCNTNKRIILQHKRKLDNWLMLQKENYILKTQDESEINELTEQFNKEKNFREKIAIKKKIEELKKEKENLQTLFHEEMSKLESQADEQQIEFEETILKQPSLISKMIVEL
ncbi:MAG: DISARM system SNF2-like helicase DrmD [Treponema sp.]|nr:DISARM system SNF2-like helicase DrmD [Treponema sp.]